MHTQNVAPPPATWDSNAQKSNNGLRRAQGEHNAVAFDPLGTQQPGTRQPGTRAVTLSPYSQLCVEATAVANPSSTRAPAQSAPDHDVVTGNCQSQICPDYEFAGDPFIQTLAHGHRRAAPCTGFIGNAAPEHHWGCMCPGCTNIYATQQPVLFNSNHLPLHPTQQEHHVYSGCNSYGPWVAYAQDEHQHAHYPAVYSGATTSAVLHARAETDVPCIHPVAVDLTPLQPDLFDTCSVTASTASTGTVEDDSEVCDQETLPSNIPTINKKAPLTCSGKRAAVESDTDQEASDVKAKTAAADKPRKQWPPVSNVPDMQCHMVWSSWGNWSRPVTQLRH